MGYIGEVFMEKTSRRLTVDIDEDVYGKFVKFVPYGMRKYLIERAISIIAGIGERSGEAGLGALLGGYVDIVPRDNHDTPSKS